MPSSSWALMGRKWLMFHGSIPSPLVPENKKANGPAKDLKLWRILWKFRVLPKNWGSYWSFYDWNESHIVPVTTAIYQKNLPVKQSTNQESSVEFHLAQHWPSRGLQQTWTGTCHIFVVSVVAFAKPWFWQICWQLIGYFSLLLASCSSDMFDIPHQGRKWSQAAHLYANHPGNCHCYVILAGLSRARSSHEAAENSGQSNRGKLRRGPAMMQLRLQTSHIPLRHFV